MTEMDNKNTTDYKNHFDNGPIPSWIIDADTMQFLEVNNAAVANYGYSKEEFLTLNIKAIRPVEDVAAMVVNYNKRKSDYYDAGINRHMRKDGTVFYVHIYSHATQFGNLKARLCFAIDVNDKVLADQKNTELMALLKERKEELKDILSSLDEAIWTRNADTFKLIYGNKAYFEMYGFDQEHINSDVEFVLNSVYPQDRNLVQNALSQIKKAGHTEIIYRHVATDGSLRAFKVRVLYKKGTNNKPDIISGVTTDITQEKELFDAMRNNEQNLLATINNTRDLIWSVDKELRITYCNKAYQDFFLSRSGVAIDEGDYVLGKWHSDSFIARRIRDYERALSGESFSIIVVEFYNGSEQYNEISSTPIMDQDGRITGVNCIARDISEERKQLINIREQNEKIKEIARSKTRTIKEQLAVLKQTNAENTSISRDVSTIGILHDNLATAILELDLVEKELTGIATNIDTYFPDTEDIIARL